MTASRPSKPPARAISSIFVLGDLIDGGANAHRDVRGRHQVVKTFGCERRNFREWLAGDQGRRELRRDRNGNFHGFGFQPRFD